MAFAQLRRLGVACWSGMLEWHVGVACWSGMGFIYNGCLPLVLIDRTVHYALLQGVGVNIAKS
jgi:hypothetical protein